MSWFEWGCYLLKLQKRIEKENFYWEEEWERTRTLGSWIIQSQGGKSKPIDMVELPRDKNIKKVSTPLTPEEVIKRFGKRGK